MKQSKKIIINNIKKAQNRFNNFLKDMDDNPYTSIGILYTVDEARELIEYLQLAIDYIESEGMDDGK